MNIDPDMNKKTNLDSGVLKQLFDGTEISAENKYKSSITFKPFAKFLMATNHWENINLSANTVRRRVIVFLFKRKSTKDIEHLEELLYKELDGIFAWSYLGLKKLIRNDMILDIPKELSIDHLTKWQQSEKLIEDMRNWLS